MAYKVIILYQLYMPSYFLGTFTEYPNLGLIHINKKPDVKSGFRSCPTKIRTWTNRTRICCAAITPLDSVVFYDGTKVILYLNITKKNRYIL